MTQTVDVLVVGGGPAGSAAAITAAEQVPDVLVVDRFDGTAFKIGEGLPPVANRVLASIGISREALLPFHNPSWGTRAAWGHADIQDRDHLGDPDGHGWVLDRRRFDQQMQERARLAGAQTLTRVRITSARREGRRWLLRAEGPSGPLQVDAAAVVDASGRARAFARLLGIPVVRRDHLTAFLVRMHAGETDVESRILVEATRDGWWYTVRLPHRERLFVFLTDPGTKAAALAHDPAGFARLLGATSHVSALVPPGPLPNPLPHRAESSRMERFAGPSWLAAGDAAATLDPLSSQGILHAIHTGSMAGRAAAGLPNDPGLGTSYSDTLEELDRAYLENRSRFYAAETRWSSAPFWASRSALAKDSRQQHREEDSVQRRLSHAR